MAQDSEKRFRSIMDKLFHPPKSSSNNPSLSTPSSSGVQQSVSKKRPYQSIALGVMDRRGDGQSVWSQPPTLTLDLVEHILCRLSVKLLMPLRCVCKSWNSLISDPIFAKKHLRLSRTLYNRHHLISCPSKPRFQQWESRLSSFFNSASTSFPKTLLSFPLDTRKCTFKVIGSCDGIICFSTGIYDNCVIVWNPTINKFKILPPMENQPELKPNWSVDLDAATIYAFGYDCLTDNYKVVAFCCYQVAGVHSWVCKNVEVHTLGTNVWKTIRGLPSFPFGPGFTVSKCGIFLSGTVNWMGIASYRPFIKRVIFSFDLGNESYQELLPPDDGGVDVSYMSLGVLRDCLCILALASATTRVIHVWLMEDYGNKDSWTKLFNVFCYDELFIGQNLTPVCPLYILEDGQLLLDFTGKLVVYNARNGTAKIFNIQSIPCDGLFDNHVYVESLISP